MSASNSSVDLSLARLREVRSVLLRLHKALLDSERTLYEQVYGQISTRGEFFRLVIDHEWFSWLRPISQFIVQIDQTLGSKEPATGDQATQLLQAARQLLSPNSQGTPLEQRYYYAIQRDPDIALMNAELSDLLVAPK
ncbi:MAG TPA: hypothetical protein V6D18_05845 [Thermosynechococcaceae cyanobacterium]